MANPAFGLITAFSEVSLKKKDNDYWLYTRVCGIIDYYPKVESKGRLIKVIMNVMI